MVNASAPRSCRSEQWRSFYSCNHFNCVEFGRRGKAGDGRGTMSTWQKMWLEHKVVAQQSLTIGVASSSAHLCSGGFQLWLLKFSTGCAPKCAPGRARWEEWGWEGMKTHSKTREKGERTDGLGRKERCDQGREQGNKNSHYSKEERVEIWKGNWRFTLAVEKIKVE